MENYNFFGRKDNVELKAYNKNYPLLFQREVENLHFILPKRLIEIFHIGSTAIPNLISKPIIDIAITIKPFPLYQSEIQILKNYGYIFWKENSNTDRMFFLKGMPRTHHLHIYPIGHQKLKKQLIFRNKLIRNEQLRIEYGKLKSYLVKKYFNNREKYTEEKSDFMKKHIKN